MVKLTPDALMGLRDRALLLLDSAIVGGFVEQPAQNGIARFDNAA